MRKTRTHMVNNQSGSCTAQSFPGRDDSAVHSVTHGRTHGTVYRFGLCISAVFISRSGFCGRQSLAVRSAENAPLTPQHADDCARSVATCVLHVAQQTDLWPRQTADRRHAKQCITRVAQSARQTDKDRQTDRQTDTGRQSKVSSSDWYTLRLQIEVANYHVASVMVRRNQLFIQVACNHCLIARSVCIEVSTV